jgi:hypothetical protein
MKTFSQKQVLAVLTENNLFKNIYDYGRRHFGGGGEASQEYVPSGFLENSKLK